MAEAEHNSDEISIPTPWGNPIIARGSMVILITLLISGAYLTYAWNTERAHEHHEILAAINYQSCLQRLNLYVVSAKDPTSLNLTSLPSELWNCLPRFLSEDQQEKRKQREK